MNTYINYVSTYYTLQEEKGGGWCDLLKLDVWDFLVTFMVLNVRESSKI